MKTFLLFSILSMFISAQAFADYREVLTAIETRIENDKEISGYELDMDFNRGHLTLSGRVGTEANRTRIANLAGSTDGVKTVTNELLIAPELAPKIEVIATTPKVISDQELKKNVIEGLERSYEGKLPEIGVEASDGLVRFSGSTDSFRTIDRILSIALMIDGVKDIDSKMTVNGEPYPLPKKE